VRRYDANKRRNRIPSDEWLFLFTPYQLNFKTSSLCSWQRNTASYVSKLFKLERIKTHRLIIWPVVSYGCEIWSPTLREEYSLKVYFVLWPTNAQLSHKLSHSYMFRHCRVIPRELVLNALPSYTSISNAAVGNRVCNYDVSCRLFVKHLNYKLYYQQLHLKYLYNLARYWLKAPWGWHDSVETCRGVIICEIIVRLLVMVQNNKRCTVNVLK